MPCPTPVALAITYFKLPGGIVQGRRIADLLREPEPALAQLNPDPLPLALFRKAAILKNCDSAGHALQAYAKIIKSK
jgi:hypothetical protein